MQVAQQRLRHRTGHARSRAVDRSGDDRGARRVDVASSTVLPVLPQQRGRGQELSHAYAIAPRREGIADPAILPAEHSCPTLLVPRQVALEADDVRRVQDLPASPNAVPVPSCSDDPRVVRAGPHGSERHHPPVRISELVQQRDVHAALTQVSLQVIQPDDGVA
jgi:hypothetical protein